MRQALYVLADLYAVLSTVAAAYQIRRSKERDAPIIMIAGGAVLLLAIFLHMRGWGMSWLLTLIGCGMISTSAFLNGRRSDSFHPFHHVIRFAVMVLLTVGFFLL